MTTTHVLAAVCAVCAAFAIYIVFALSRISAGAKNMEQTAKDTLERMRGMEEELDETNSRMTDGFSDMRREQREASAAARDEQTRGINALGDSQARRVKEIGDMQSENFNNFSKQLTALGEIQAQRIKEISASQTESLASFSNQITNLSRLNEEKLEAVRSAVEEKLLALYKNNEEKLEKIRSTVDEQLHSTLEKRLGEAFSTVSERLEQVHKGLGEMKALTADVGDLKKVLSNIKTRGAWGEAQLRALLEQILTKEQYAENISTRPNSAERVEFAVVLPGASGERPVYLPIDSKFPVEDYQRLITASEQGDAAGISEARRALASRVKDEAKTVSEKYIEPPYTTDFGILYLPIEGLYAEVLRIDGLCEQIARDFKIVPAGPVTICALLNSLQMGFRTLAIEKRSSEVWALLGKVKSEFEKFGDVLDKTRQKIDQAGKELDKAGVRSRAINRALNDVQRTPVEGENGLLFDADVEDGDDTE